MNIYCHTSLDQSLSERLINEIPSGYSIVFRTENDDQNFENFSEADIILGNPPVEWFTQRTKNIKFWQLDSAGFDQYSDVQLDSDTKVANMGSWFARPCAETIIGGVLALYRGIDKLTLLKTKSQWVGAALRNELKLLHNQKVLLLGAGTIGLATKAILEGMGCQIDILARTSPVATIRSKEDLLPRLNEFDLVVNTLPGTAKHFVDTSFLSSMKAGSVYSSVGRGTTTDEFALIEALKSGHLSGAVLDVTEQEPLPANSPLWEMEQVVLTQHTGGGHREEHLGKVDLFLTNIFGLENGADIIDSVDINKGY